MTDVLIRPADHGTHDPVTSPRRSRRIVVAVDGSEASLEALRWVEHELLRPGDDVRVVTAFAPPLATPEAPLSVDVIHESAECARTAAVMVIRAVFGPDEPGHVVEHVLAAGNIESLAVRESADASLVVLGARPPRGLLERLRPSATKRITRHASCPVVSVPISSGSTPEPTTGAP